MTGLVHYIDKKGVKMHKSEGERLGLPILFSARKKQPFLGDKQIELDINCHVSKKYPISATGREIQLVSFSESLTINEAVTLLNEKGYFLINSEDHEHLGVEYGNKFSHGKVIAGFDGAGNVEALHFPGFSPIVKEKETLDITTLVHSKYEKWNERFAIYA